MNAQHSNNLESLSTYYAQLKSRDCYSKYPESPKAYSEESLEKGKTDFQKRLNTDYLGLYSEGSTTKVGEEVSPFMQVGLGILYPSFSVSQLVSQAQRAAAAWAKANKDTRAAVLLESLDEISLRFSELAYATMHTTGQSFLMSFQASGPHALDRALEAITMGVVELDRYVESATWTKNMGKFDLVLQKNFKAIPKGVGVLIGCSTFPTWNTLPGLYANLITGNVSICKPHPKAIYPMAIVVEALQTVLVKHGFDPCVVQLAPDTLSAPITKELCEHPAVKLIDYTGGNAFGDYVESLKGKETFTEKAGINSVILDSCTDIQKTAQNIAFSMSLYSGQMCTAPQNIYIASAGIQTPNGVVSVSEFKQILSEAIQGLVNHPKAGPGTIAAIQNDATLQRIEQGIKSFSDVVLAPAHIVNPEFETARVQTPALVAVSSKDKALYLQEYFGPFGIIVETDSFEESLSIAASSAMEKGAITCLAFCTDATKCDQIETAMNAAFTPVSFNLSGAAFVNQHAAFSDFHVTGGNPAGNASFTDPNFVNRRYIWVGNRYMSE